MCGQTFYSAFMSFLSFYTGKILSRKRSNEFPFHGIDGFPPCAFAISHSSFCSRKAYASAVQNHANPPFGHHWHMKHQCCNPRRKKQKRTFNTPPAKPNPGSRCRTGAPQTQLGTLQLGSIETGGSPQFTGHRHPTTRAWKQQATTPFTAIDDEFRAVTPPSAGDPFASRAFLFLSSSRFTTVPGSSLNPVRVSRTAAVRKGHGKEFNHGSGQNCTKACSWDNHWAP